MSNLGLPNVSKVDLFEYIVNQEKGHNLPMCGIDMLHKDWRKYLSSPKLVGSRLSET